MTDEDGYGEEKHRKRIHADSTEDEAQAVDETLQEVIDAPKLVLARRSNLMNSESTCRRKISSTVVLGFDERAHARVSRRKLPRDARIGGSLTPDGLVVELDGGR